MTDYTKLVAALRCGTFGDDECGNSDCPYWSGLGCMDGIATEEAADAIEADEKRIAELSLDNKMLKNTIDADKGVMLDRIRYLEAQLPKRGEWVELGYQPNVHETRYRCSLCGRQVSILSGSGELLKTYPYCHCGAKMEVQDDKA